MDTTNKLFFLDFYYFLLFGWFSCGGIVSELGVVCVA